MAGIQMPYDGPNKEEEPLVTKASSKSDQVIAWTVTIFMIGLLSLLLIAVGKWVF